MIDLQQVHMYTCITSCNVKILNSDFCGNCGFLKYLTLPQFFDPRPEAAVGEKGEDCWHSGRTLFPGHKGGASWQEDNKCDTFVEEVQQKKANKSNIKSAEIIGKNLRCWIHWHLERQGLIKNNVSLLGEIQSDSFYSIFQ